MSKKKTVTKWIVVLALGVVTLYLYRPRSRHSEIRLSGFESFALAESLIEHHGFSDPFEVLPTGPSAHLAPLYPAYLALIMMTFGKGAVGAGIIIWTAVCLLALQLMMLPFLSERLGMGFWTGCLASLAWLAAGIPPSYLWESNFTSILVIAVSCLMASSCSGVLSRKQIWMSGVVWGALLLLQPVVIMVFLAWLLLLHFRTQTPWARKLALGIVPIIVVAPWVVRNSLIFHQPVFIRDNLGIELAVSNNSCAAAVFEDNDRSTCFEATHPNKSLAEAVRVRQFGEVEYNRMKMKEAMTWIRANPKAFLILSVGRFEAFWLPRVSENKNNGVIWRPFIVQLFTLLTIPGLFFMWRNSRIAAYIVGLWLVFFPPIYYVIQFMDRYRYPIFWASFLSGSYFVVEMVRGLVGGRQETSRGGVGAPDRDIA